jgi:phosphate transport system permease protein
LLLSSSAALKRRILSLTGQGFLLAVTVCSAGAVLFILGFIIYDSVPFFSRRGFLEFFTTNRWYPSREPAEFGALAIFAGSAIVTIGAAIFAVPAGVAAAVCLSDVIPFSARQAVKPIIEMLAAIPSVAYGFFALVVLAPVLQKHGGRLLWWTVWVMGGPLAMITVVVLGDLLAARLPERLRRRARWTAWAVLSLAAFAGLYYLSSVFGMLKIPSGTNALNASFILGIMALPTVVSVSEDALQAAGRDLREGSYALGATRAETLVRVVIPAASSGIVAAIILGLMRAIGETMVVWMASGNAAQFPSPWYNFLDPVRTLTATIAGDMGEADQTYGLERFHVYFAMAACLLIISLIFNLASELILRRSRKKLAGG